MRYCSSQGELSIIQLLAESAQTRIRLLGFEVKISVQTFSISTIAINEINSILTHFCQLILKSGVSLLYQLVGRGFIISVE